MFWVLKPDKTSISSKGGVALATNSKEYQREYMKKYRKANKDKIIKANKRYWDKKHEETAEHKKDDNSVEREGEGDGGWLYCEQKL